MPKIKSDLTEAAKEYLDIKKTNLGFVNGALVEVGNRHAPITFIGVPFDNTEFHKIKDQDIRTSILKKNIVFFLREISKEIPSYAKEQDYQLDHWSYAPFGYYENLLSQCTEEEKNIIQYEDVKVFDNAFDKIVLPDRFKERIIEALATIKGGQKIFQEWGLEEKIKRGRGVNLLFSGFSGTGKTYCGEIIGEYLGATVDIVSAADFESKWVGETEQNISSLFKHIKGANTVLVIDEADSFLSTRKERSNEYTNKLTNQLLIELERHNGICILTTNRPVSLDQALHRRVDLVLDFPKPNRKARRQIFEFMIPKKMPTKDMDLDALAAYDLTGGLIKNIVLSAAKKAVTRGMDEVPMALFVEAAEEEIQEEKTLTKEIM